MVIQLLLLFISSVKLLLNTIYRYINSLPAGFFHLTLRPVEFLKQPYQFCYPYSKDQNFI